MQSRVVNEKKVDGGVIWRYLLMPVSKRYSAKTPA